MAMQTVVVAEDEGAIRDLLAHHLEREGFAVVGASDGQTALRRARSLADLLILDVGLPGMDGFDVARTLRREHCVVPIVMLTARTDEIDRVVGFELGVDDYICKPFSPREVVARIKAILRRSGMPPALTRPTLKFGRLEIDERAREARVDGTDARLKPREFALLVELAGADPAKSVGIRFRWGRAYGRRARPATTGQARRTVATPETGVDRARLRLQIPAALTTPMPNFRRLVRAVGERVEAGGCVPLLVLRVPEFERIAWLDGRHAARAAERQTIAAFRTSAPRILRAGDAPAHRPGTNRFAVAMLAPARRGSEPGAADARAALSRIASALSRSTGRHVQGGWWPVKARTELDSLATTLDAALERGAREREHGALLATVGHELRTPLTSIRGYLETSLAEELDDPTARRFLETARCEALRLGRLVEGMLEFSMLDLSAGEREGRCDVVEQIRAAVAAAIPLARRRCVTIGARLPQTAGARVDADVCMRALVNLVENAVECGREGGRVEIACGLDDRFVTVSVDDDGPGVMPAEREAIFEMGVRGKDATHRGHNIGLSVVKTTAQHSGGDVRALDSPLGGARFVLRFPSV
ncbi:MAG TPA: response regulator [Candidatus Tumulicola sp.]|jgi:two-component system alkaline phosphatase synthesis response regulator PhoP